MKNEPNPITFIDSTTRTYVDVVTDYWRSEGDEGGVYFFVRTRNGDEYTIPMEQLIETHTFNRVVGSELVE